MSRRVFEPEIPCARCGAPVEPVRAPCVSWLDGEERPRVYCGASCRDADARPAPAVPAERSPRVSRASETWSQDSELLVPRVQRASSATWTGRHDALAPAAPLAPPPTLALGLACAAIVTAAFARTHSIVAIAAVFVLGSALAALAGGAHLRTSAGWLAYLAGPIAAGFATLSAISFHHDGDDARLALVGAAFVAALANLRWWLDSLTDAPIHALGSRLRHALPSASRLIRADGALVETPEDKVRVGEEIEVAEGERVTVDGVISRGSALVLPYPAARSPRRRVVGQPLLAGARIVEGRVRVRATHVGADRALLRPLGFGDATARDAASLTRRAARLLALAALFTLGGAILGVLLAPAEAGLGARLAAAAAALVAVPVLALRRASSMPYTAAGLAAVERGIRFASAATIDAAGRVSSTVLSTHGTLTEGAPEVVEVHGIDTQSPDEVERALLLAAAAEEGSVHPFARAIATRAGDRALPSVRKITKVPGRGVRATSAAGETILVGSRTLLLDDGTSVAVAEGAVQRAEERGQSVVFVAEQSRARAWIAIRDEVRPGARASVQRMIDLDVEVLVLSGDHRGTVEALARAVDVDNVKAELAPDERAAEVRRLRELGSRVCVVGHVTHDAEMLSAADVPLMLDAAGAPEADRGISLASDDLRDASAALWIARAARHDALRASVAAIAAGCLLALVGALGLAAPGVVAVLAVFVDLYSLPVAARVLSRIDLRFPSRG